jgi:hypothetical protein
MQLSPKQLATKVAKESKGVSVRHGKTNGQDVLHLVRRNPAESLTIPATSAAWDAHPWNDASLYSHKSKEDS